MVVFAILIVIGGILLMFCTVLYYATDPNGRTEEERLFERRRKAKRKMVKLMQEKDSLKAETLFLQAKILELELKGHEKDAEILAYRYKLPWINVEELDGSQE